MKKRVFIYVRVSTQEQYKEGYSVGEQTERLKKYCEAMGWIVVKIYTDAHTGADMERPALQEMIEAVKQGKADSVVVYKLDRLSRSQKDTLTLIEDILLKNGVDFVSMSENFDTATPFGRAIIGILAVFAQLEREQIRERMIMGKDARAKEGKWNGGCHVPIGYSYVDGELKINEFEAMQVKELFDMFFAGNPLYRIEREFEEKGYRMRKNRWDRRNMRYTMRNRTYIGELSHGGVWYQGIHDPIIDKDVFDAVNKELDKRRKRFEEQGYKTGTKAHTTHLGGLIHCAHCKGKFSKNQTGNKQYGFHMNYTCYSRHKRVKTMIKDRNCKNKSYRVNELDEHVFRQIRKLSLDPEYHITNLQEKNVDDDNQRKIRLIQAEIKNIDAQRTRYMSLYGNENYTIEELDGLVKPLNERKLSLMTEIKRLTNTETKLPKDEAIRIIDSFADVLEKGDLHEVRSLLELLIEKIVIDNETIDIHWTFA